MKRFRDRLAEFTKAGAQVLGISMDDVETQREFAQSVDAPFPLLADPDGKVAAAYGVKQGAVARRVTFVIGKDGRIRSMFEGAQALDPSGALSACGRTSS
jgi:peroxiredoxin Q/BCP